MDLKSLCLRDLTLAENTALHDYKTAKGRQGESLCYDLNRRLEMALWPDELPAEVRTTALGLDSVLNRAPPLPSPAFPMA